jgi:hypothetical protein
MRVYGTLAAAAAFAILGTGSAEAGCPLEGATAFCHENSTSGRYAMVPGCCANAPRPTEQLDTRKYIYPDGRVVIVYPDDTGNRAGYQDWWWKTGH